uniref:Uncharacterized protein n=1 Tax=Trichobilharzia regenti TaxID=157069 RepID=A0AA85J6T7_TRIRE
ERRTFWLFQEKTDSLVFGWNRFVEEGIKYLVLEREVDWALDDTVDVLSGDTAELNVIGWSCKLEKYNIIAKSKIASVPYDKAKRSLTYNRVTRITKVHLPLYTDASPYLTWKTEGSFCSEDDVIVIFKGYSDQPLELHFIPNTDKSFYLESEGKSEGQTEEVIISSLHGKRFSLPKLVTRGGESNEDSYSYERGNQEKHNYQEDEEEEITTERPVISRKEDGLEKKTVNLLVPEQVDSFSPEYLEGNAERGERRTFWLLQEKTDSLVFGWNRFVEEGIKYLVLEREVDWALDDTVDVLSGNTAELSVIGRQCKPEKYNIIAKSKIAFVPYDKAKRSLTYNRVTRITKVHLPLYTDASPYLTWKTEGSFCSEDDVIVIFKGYSDQPLELHFIPNTDKSFYLESEGKSEGQTEEVIISSLHGKRFSLPKLVNLLVPEQVDTFSPEYLEGNAERGERRTFWLLQEKTDSLVFGWNRFVEEGIKYLVLEREVDWALDDTVDVLSGNTAELSVIGRQCKPEKYNIIAKSKIAFVPYDKAKRSLTYNRVTRITKVHLPLYTDASPYLTWKTEGSFCSEDDVIVIFKGYSDQPLELHFIPNTDKSFYLESEGKSEGQTEEVIISSLHGKRFSLPKLGKYYEAHIID